MGRGYSSARKRKRRRRSSRSYQGRTLNSEPFRKGLIHMPLNMMNNELLFILKLSFKIESSFDLFPKNKKVH